MAKRFTSTDIWDEDWFLDMPDEYQLFWYYMLSKCDHAGLYKVNVKAYNAVKKTKVDPKKALEFFNVDKERIRVVNAGLWFIEDFICFQYGNHLNPRSKTHESILKLLEKFNINPLSIRGLGEVVNGSSRGLGEVVERSSRGQAKG